MALMFALVSLSSSGLAEQESNSGQGMDRAALSSIKPRLEEIVDRRQIPGVVYLIAHHGHIDALDSVGWMNIEDKKPLRTDSIFQIMSMTENFAGFAIMMLVEEERPADHVFPLQMEMIPVLEAAMAVDPADAHAPYYLGDLLFDSQPERAVELWKKSASLNAGFPFVYRNLPLASRRESDDSESRERARIYLEKAVSVEGSAMALDDLDRHYEGNGVSVQKRLAVLVQHPQTVTAMTSRPARQIRRFSMANVTRPWRC